MTKRKYVSIILDGMAKGLFSSLIVGVILKQLGTIFGIKTLIEIGQYAQFLMGPCIGAGVAYVRGSKQFTLLSAIVVGAIGAGTVIFGINPDTNIATTTITIGEPIGAFIAALVAVEIGKKLEGKSKFDLLIVPICLILIGGLVGRFISPPISEFMKQIGVLINTLTVLQPIPMGLLLGITVGMILTLPISSAALCISIGISGIAAGAALAGCAAQMVGFAIISYKDNKISGLISQGIGTSMLQVPNIIKNPWIWVPPTIAGAIVGVLSTTIFQIETTSVGAGMGTSGLVGQFATVSVMGNSSIWIMLILHFILPAVISYLIYLLLYKKSLIKDGDMTI